MTEREEELSAEVVIMLIVILVGTFALADILFRAFT